VSSHPQTPFDSIESAHEYIRLLEEAISEAVNDVSTDVAKSANGKPDRRVEALRLVHYKLQKLEQSLHNSSRLLNDLRSLRRLLFEERIEVASTANSPTGKHAAA